MIELYKGFTIVSQEVHTDVIINSIHIQLLGVQNIVFRHVKLRYVIPNFSHKKCILLKDIFLNKNKI